ncbi:hypothetical protein ABK046_52400, partial [Streptomyces caeruleatus]
IISSNDWTRIASTPAAMDLHRTLPVQSSLKGIVRRVDGSINYYLDPLDWSKKADGTPSDLTGTDGNVNVFKSIDTY